MNNKFLYIGDNKIAPVLEESEIIRYDSRQAIEVNGNHNWEKYQILVEGVDFDKCVIAFGLTTRVWTYSEIYGAKYGCSECCNGDRCDEDCKAKYKGRRKDCPHCKGSGWIKKEDVEKEVAVPISKPNTDVKALNRVLYDMLEKGLITSLYHKNIIEKYLSEGKELYSKEDMIGFADWIVENRYTNTADYQKKWFQWGDWEETIYTTEQLFNLYTQSPEFKNNQK